MEVQKENNTLGVVDRSAKGNVTSAPQSARKALGKVNKDVSTRSSNLTAGASFRSDQLQSVKKKMKNTMQHVEEGIIKRQQAKESSTKSTISENEEWPEIESFPMCTDPKTGCKECFPEIGRLLYDFYDVPPLTKEAFAWMKGHSIKSASMKSAQDRSDDEDLLRPLSFLPIELPPSFDTFE